MGRESISGSKVRSKGLAEYALYCERCGVQLEHRKRTTKLCIACIRDPLWGRTREERGLIDGSTEDLH